MGKKKRRRSRKSGNAVIFWMIGIFGFLILVGGGLTWFLLKKSPELKKVRVETDRVDPGWRLKDLAANQRTMADAENGGNIVLSVAKQIPPNVRVMFGDAADRKNPSQPTPDADVAQLRNTLQMCGAAVAEARKINYCSDGVYAIPFNLKEPMQTLVPHAEASRLTAQVLVYDSYLRAADRDGPGAVQSARALLNLSRYHRDEPILLVQLVRVAIRRQAISALERSLTCANIPDDALPVIQRTLEEEGTTSLLRVGLRGERANLDAWATSVANGNTTWGPVSLSDNDVAWCLRHFNAAIDLADKPTEQNQQQWQRLDEDLARAPDNIKRVMPDIGKVRTALVRSVAEMRAAAIALALERYRRARGDWPTDLNQLVPDYMKMLPVDPNSGGPFRYSHPFGGISVYALGTGAPDFKGEFLTIGSKQHEGLGFRLLDANGRR